MKLLYVIVALRKGIWYYMTGWDDKMWVEDLYSAKKFASYDLAHQELKDGCDKKHWGGYFRIDAVYVNR